VGLTQANTLGLTDNISPFSHPSSRIWIAVVAAVALHASVVLYQPRASRAEFVPNVFHVMEIHYLPAATATGENSAPASGSIREAQVDVAEPQNVKPPSQETPRISESSRAENTGARPASRSSPSPAATPYISPSLTAAATNEGSAGAASPTSVAKVLASPAESLPPAPDYLLGSRLDPGPHPLGDIEPQYPDSANLQEGAVVLRLLISETGAVDNVAVVRAFPSGLFEHSAIEAFSTAKFSPGLVLGMPVKSQLMIDVHFAPINRGARVSGRSY